MTDTSHQMNQDRAKLPERVELARRNANPKRTADIAEYVILVFLPHNKPTPFVTWVESATSQATYWGHYHRDLPAALEDFETR